MPQKPCSQARCVPVRSRSSRRKSASVRRGSTSRSYDAAVDLDADGTWRSCVSLSCVRARRGALGGRGPAPRGAGAPPSTSMSSGGSMLGERARRALRRPPARADGVDAVGRVATRSRTSSAAFAVERRRAPRPRPGRSRGSRALTSWKPRPIRGAAPGSARVTISSSGSSAVSCGPRKKSRAGDRALAARRPDVDRRVERDGGGGQLCPRRCERERAADGAATTRLQVADVPRPPRAASGHDAPTTLVLEQALLAHERADVQLAVALLQHVEAVRRRSGRRARSASAVRNFMSWHEALAAGEHLRAVSVREQLERLVDRGRRVVRERRRLHGTVTTIFACGPAA